MNINAPAQNKIRILIADDHPVVRDGLAGVIDEQADMAVVGQVGTGTEALALFQTHQPDITLMDLRMPGMNGVDTIAAIRRHSPTALVIILSTYDAGGRHSHVRRKYRSSGGSLHQSLGMHVVVLA